jgi:hypothetical protein
MEQELYITLFRSVLKFAVQSSDSSSFELPCNEDSGEFLKPLDCPSVGSLYGASVLIECSCQYLVHVIAPRTISHMERRIWYRLITSYCYP